MKRTKKENDRERKRVRGRERQEEGEAGRRRGREGEVMGKINVRGMTARERVAGEEVKKEEEIVKINKKEKRGGKREVFDG